MSRVERTTNEMNILADKCIKIFEDNGFVAFRLTPDIIRISNIKQKSYNKYLTLDVEIHHYDISQTIFKTNRMFADGNLQNFSSNMVIDAECFKKLMKILYLLPPPCDMHIMTWNESKPNINYEWQKFIENQKKYKLKDNDLILLKKCVSKGYVIRDPYMTYVTTFL